LLDGVSVVLCARIGDSPRERLAAAGIRAIDSHAHEYIEMAVAQVFVKDLGATKQAALTA
jgi:nitrogen fixation protein NifB